GDLYIALLSAISGSLSSIGAKDVATGAFLSSIGGFTSSISGFPSSISGFTKMGTSSFSGCPYQIRFLVLAIYILSV
ncbi:MAG TPA: hypothetical protein VLQ66_01670, partial [Paenisporosarcina sp.]|nr:hypothetical protein [Paenisporosarcina sp.]